MVGPVGVAILRACLWAGALSLMAPSAAADWLDDMPSVSAVAQAVREQALNDAAQLPSGSFTGGPRPAMPSEDPDHYATRLAGTLSMLRWFMVFEALRETNPAPVASMITPLREPQMSDQRRRRMDALAVEYRQVELAIERGLGKRAGYIKKVCDRKDSYLNRLGGKMFKTPQDCYRWRYGNDVDGAHIQFSWRQGVFPRLFCDKGQRYHERYQEYYKDASHTHPGNRGPRPHNYAFVRVKQWPVIAEPMTTTAVCAPHGGDANGDGICDAWQGPKPPNATASCVFERCPDPPVSRLPGWPLGKPSYRAQIVPTGVVGITRDADECKYSSPGVCWQYTSVEFRIVKPGDSRSEIRYEGWVYKPGSLARQRSHPARCAELDPRFNCHGLSLTAGHFWLREDTTERILKDWCGELAVHSGKRREFRSPIRELHAGDIKVFRRKRSLGWIPGPHLIDGRPDVFLVRHPDHSQTLRSNLIDVDQKPGPIRYGQLPSWLDLGTQSWNSEDSHEPVLYRCDF